MADGRGDRRVAVTGEPPEGLLGDPLGAHSGAGPVERVDGPDIHLRHANPARADRAGHATHAVHVGRAGHVGPAGPARQCLAQLDGPLPVRRGFGVAEYPLGGLGSRDPGGQFGGRIPGGLPVPGYLRASVVAGRRQRPRYGPVQRGPLAGQQPGGHRLGQQRMPGPVLAPGGVLGQQPGRGQLPQPAAHRLRVQAGDRGQRLLGQRPARHRQSRQHRACVTGAASRPGRQQLRQPGRQPGRGLQQPALRRVGQGRGHQLLGEKRVPLRPHIQLIDHPRRHRAAGQRGHLPGQLRPGQRAQPDLLHPGRAAHLHQPVRHVRCRCLIAAARGHHGHRVAVPGARQEGQEIQRRAVRPVHILDHQRDRGPGPRPGPGPGPGPGSAGRRVQQLRDRQEQPPPLPSLLPASLLRPGTRTKPGQQPPDLPPHVLRGGRQRRLQQAPAVQPGQVIQRGDDRQQRQPLAQRQAFPACRHHPRDRGPGHGLPGEPRLAHPRIAHHEHHPGLVGQRSKEPGQLILTPDKRRRRSHALTPPGPIRQVNPCPPQTRTTTRGPPGKDDRMPDPSRALRPTTSLPQRCAPDGPATGSTG